MRPLIRSFVVFVGASILALGVQPKASAASTDSLTQGRWLWQRSQYADGSSLEAADPNKYTIALLDDGRMSIQADCNIGSSSYTLTDAEITIQPGPMTEVACRPGSQDIAFLHDLVRAASYG